MVGSNGLYFASVRAYSYDTGIKISKLLKGKVDLAPDGYELVRSEKLGGRFNLLQHSIINYYRNDNGQYIKQLVIFRAKTLFIVAVLGQTDDFSGCEALFDSVDVDLTTWGYFLIVKSRLGFVWGSLLLTLFPLFCYRAGNNLRKWRRSCKQDRAALLWFAVSSIVVAAVMAVTVVLLRDCPMLVLWVLAAMTAFGLMFFFDNKFLKSVFDGMFGI